MSDYSPPNRPGLTRNGKSIKAVRRYYALKDNSQRRQRSPNRTPVEEDDRSFSKRKRSPDDDKLSKRIAAEIKVQQEANEKRVRQDGSFSNNQTDRSALPALYLQPKDTGPAFVNKIDASQRPKSVKSTRSIKSNKSFVTMGQNTNNSEVLVQRLGPVGLSFILTCFILAVVYILTWIFLLILNRDSNDKKDKSQDLDKTYFSIQFIALSSIPVILAVPYWFFEQQQSRLHAVICFILMLTSSVSVLVHIVTLLIKKEDTKATSNQQFLKLAVTIHFWFVCIYLMLLIIADVLMVKQIMSMIIIKPEETRRSTRPPPNVENNNMSMFLSPH